MYQLGDVIKKQFPGFTPCPGHHFEPVDLGRIAGRLLRQQGVEPQCLVARLVQHLRQLVWRSITVVLHRQQAQALAENALRSGQRDDFAVSAAQLLASAVVRGFGQQHQCDQHQHTEHGQANPHAGAHASTQSLGVDLDVGGDRIRRRRHTGQSQRKALRIRSITVR